jgi:hypothetical protein
MHRANPEALQDVGLAFCTKCVVAVNGTGVSPAKVPHALSPHPEEKATDMWPSRLSMAGNDGPSIASPSMRTYEDDRGQMQLTGI